VARQQGDDYQARWFWLQACALLDDLSKVERVVYEDDELKSFDDVAVYYRPGYKNEKGLQLDADFYQVKFHVTSAGSLTSESFCDPAFIGATKYSLLQRIKNAHDHCCANQINHRLTIYTPWLPHPDNKLAEVHSLSDGHIRWSTLAEGGDRSQSGKIRKLWREHLNLKNDGELRQILANVRIKQGPTLDDLAVNLNWRLKSAGLMPVEEGRLIHPYDELTKKLLMANMNELTNESLLEICGREGLIFKATSRAADVTSLGIRSFLQWTEDLQNQTHSMICLSEHFSGRVIKNINDWNNKIPNLVETFLRQQIARGGSYRIHLDTHSSIAYLVGYLIPEKIGVNVEVVQHSGRGRSIWHYADEQETASSLWEFIQEDGHHEAEESALAIGLSHNIKEDVMSYIRESMPSVGRIILAVPVSGPSSSAVRDGAHANDLANQLIQYLRAKGIGMSKENRLHIFSAAPNGFIFSLGRKMQSIPHWVLYEYDFGSGVIGAYSPSIMNINRS